MTLHLSGNFDLSWRWNVLVFHIFFRTIELSNVLCIFNCYICFQWRHIYNIYNVVIWFGETFISLGECVINCKCYLIQRILSPGKVKVRSVLKLWSIFTLLSDLENAVIWSPQIDYSFGSRFFIMVSISILTELIQSVILSMSAMDLDFIDPEVEAQMDERHIEEEDEIAIQGARGGGRRQWSYL